MHHVLTIADLQERAEFLHSYRHPTSEDDFLLAVRAAEWPKKFLGTLREASARANAGAYSVC